jgi:hypothetical protein
LDIQASGNAVVPVTLLHHCTDSKTACMSQPLPELWASTPALNSHQSIWPTRHWWMISTFE